MLGWLKGQDPASSQTWSGLEGTRRSHSSGERSTGILVKRGGSCSDRCSCKGCKQRLLASREPEGAWGRERERGWFCLVFCFFVFLRGCVCVRVLLKIEPKICMLGKCLFVVFSGAESLTEPRWPSDAEAAGRPRPSETPPTHQEAPPQLDPAHPRPLPCARAQVGKRRSASAQPWWRHRLAALPAQLAAGSFPGRRDSER